jgi:hypothetical protein
MNLPRCWPFLLAWLLAVSFLLGHASAEDKKTGGPEKKKKAPPAPPVIVDGEITNADLKDKLQTQSYVKTYTFKMEKDRSYQFELAGTTFRPYLRLENSAGNQVAIDFDQFGGNQSAVIIHRSAKTEDFTIVCTSIIPNSQGKFKLIVKELTGDEGKPLELKFEKGKATFNGNLAAADPRYMGKIHKMFHVKLEEGKTYQIDHMSGAFDAYLYLIGPDGSVLAQDDDGGVGLNSRIVHRAGKTGEYRIVATSLGGRQLGAFNFVVEEKK